MWRRGRQPAGSEAEALDCHAAWQRSSTTRSLTAVARRDRQRVGIAQAAGCTSRRCFDLGQAHLGPRSGRIGEMRELIRRLCWRHDRALSHILTGDQPDLRSTCRVISEGHITADGDRRAIRENRVASPGSDQGRHRGRIEGQGNQRRRSWTGRQGAVRKVSGVTSARIIAQRGRRVTWMSEARAIGEPPSLAPSSRRSRSPSVPIVARLRFVDLNAWFTPHRFPGGPISPQRECCLRPVGLIYRRRDGLPTTHLPWASSSSAVVLLYRRPLLFQRLRPRQLDTATSPRKSSSGSSTIHRARRWSTSLFLQSIAPANRGRARQGALNHRSSELRRCATTRSSWAEYLSGAGQFL